MDKETAEQLRTTKALYDDGVLTEEEYNAKKAELLHAPAVVAAQPPANDTEASSRATSSPCNRRKSTRSLDLKKTSSPFTVRTRRRLARPR